jgi:rhodanese-related sulfurtransferase
MYSAGYIQKIFMKMEAQHFQRGDSVIQQGDEGEHFYLIREGKCEVVRKTRKNPEGVTLARLGVGDNFGEEALISGGKRNASIIMLTDGVLMSLSKTDFLELMNEPLLNWVNYSEAKEIANGKGIWVDVRLPAEFQSQHLDGSVNIPLPLLRSKVEKLEKNKKYIIYCDTGRRSSTATYLLTENGFEAYVLKEGLNSVDNDLLVS